MPNQEVRPLVVEYSVLREVARTPAYKALTQEAAMLEDLYIEMEGSASVGEALRIIERRIHDRWTRSRVMLQEEQDRRGRPFAAEPSSVPEWDERGAGASVEAYRG